METINRIRNLRREFFLTPKEIAEEKSKFDKDLRLLEEAGTREAVLQIAESEPNSTVFVSVLPNRPTSLDLKHPNFTIRYGMVNYHNYVDFYPGLVFKELQVTGIARDNIIIATDRETEKFHLTPPNLNKATLVDVLHHLKLKSAKSGGICLSVRQIRDKWYPPFSGEEQIYPDTPFIKIAGSLPATTLNLSF